MDKQDVAALVFGLLWCATTAAMFAVDRFSGAAWLCVSTAVAGVVVVEGRR